MHSKQVLLSYHCGSYGLQPILPAGINALVMYVNLCNYRPNFPIITQEAAAIWRALQVPECLTPTGLQLRDLGRPNTAVLRSLCARKPAVVRIFNG